MGLIIQGNAGTNNAEVSTNSSVFVTYPTDSSAPAIYSENCAGAATGIRKVLSPETDTDYRLRVHNEIILDNEIFNYPTQNFTKYLLSNSGFSNSFTVVGLQTNTTSVTTANSNTTITTYTYFPVFSQGTITSFEASVNFTRRAPQGNIVIIGPSLNTGTASIGRETGAYFVFKDGEMSAVVNFNSDSVTAGQQGFNNNNQVKLTKFNTQFSPFRFYTFKVNISDTEVAFYIDNVLHATIETPSNMPHPIKVTSLPFTFAHIAVNASSTITTNGMNCNIKRYTVSQKGINLTELDSLTTIAKSKSYAPVPGTLVVSNYVNNTAPTAALPTNTALTANLIAALSGQCIETDTLAVNTDGVLLTIAAGVVNSTALPTTAIRIVGVKIDSFVTTTLTGGGYIAQYVLNTGRGTLNNTPNATTKAYSNRILIGQETVAVNAAAGTYLATKYIDLKDSPVYVGHTESVIISKKKIGTAPSAGAIYHTIQCFYETLY